MSNIGYPEFKYLSIIIIIFIFENLYIYMQILYTIYSTYINYSLYNINCYQTNSIVHGYCIIDLVIEN